MPIRIVDRPDDIRVFKPKGVHPPEPEVITFVSFVERFLNHPVWTKDYRLLSMSVAIERELKGEGPLVLAEEDWKALCELIRNPGDFGYGYKPWAMRQIFPYIEAIFEARMTRS